ncbi:MAG: hypothetical protein COW18_01070 [Zetaproteobacteria bacterium CG12_big_fil_rev_8_21_14_0_65_54_13]|nr:MAG: hypothetical protein COX55_03080 [Zetaproteobacteria bacterium CG23_combo_of_CG06-09_8_20_14_all_54_7]PIW51439.1 MAG: hypothetical protein COW18_01070 [Zetaproteobacteria bacterium CG12_big_fil_rev_8_21_14_0_65_54_13]PIX53229.1 MAG: hypothetical protein COZ50_14405 [Zetaproteobacteria bacterium CG_4_10_14_3_um_filter_54_28]PJA30581.1 MAG: hypothetical protein CO188_02905 [Zetaproteobacteria bacterium CG_4_9_14_3_um_filter_54_145]
MKKVILFACTGLLLAACVHSAAPADNQPFRAVSTMQTFSGSYENRGEGEAASRAVYLSSLLWGGVDVAGVAHKDIERIQVAVDGTQVSVSALSHGCVVYAKSYTEGADFKLSNGEISLKRDANLLTRGPGDVLVGPSYESVTLGLDARGDGKYRSQDAGAGLVFLMIPVAMADRSDIRFKRVDGALVTQPCGH